MVNSLAQALQITGHATITIDDYTLHVRDMGNGEVSIKEDTPHVKGEWQTFTNPRAMHAGIGVFLRRRGHWEAVSTEE